MKYSMSIVWHRSMLLIMFALALAGCSMPALPFLNPDPTSAPLNTTSVPAPTPVLLNATARIEEGGFSLRYPLGWQTREISGTLVLAPTVDALDADAPGDDLVILIESTALSAIAAESSPDNASLDSAAFFEISRREPLQAGYTLGDTTPMTIDGKLGIAADLSADSGAGQMIALVAPPQAIRIVGQAAPSAWQLQRPTFDAIVKSLSLFTPDAPATPTPEGQPAQPIITTQGPEGFVLRLGGNEGPTEGRFVAARGLAATAEGAIYLAESRRGVWVFAPDGTLVTAFGKDELLDAYDVALAPNGDLFVADFGHNAIARFSPDGTLLLRWGEIGSAPEQFDISSPQRIAAGPDGSVYALDSRVQDNVAVSSIVRFDGDDGSFIERIDLPAGSAPNDLAVDRQGNIYLAETFGNAVVKINPQGEVAARLGETITPEGIIAGAVDIDQRGNIYVATWNEGLLKFAPSGTLLARGGTIIEPGTTPKPGEFSLPNGIVAAPGNVVWVSDNSGEYSALTALRLATDAEAQATANAQATAVTTPLPDEMLLRQWANSATASSSYDSSYGPDGATGPPDVEGCMDSTDAWASADPNGLEELELGFEAPVFATQINVHQNHQPGFITRVELVDESGTVTRVYDSTAQLQEICPYVQEISFPQTLYRIVGVNLTIDQRSGANWNEIDAVELVGIP
jgi:streptogramin lyase